MIRKIIISILLGILAFFCFQIYSKLYISSIPIENTDAFVGTYEIEKVNGLDKFLLLKRNHLKRAFFQETKGVLHLKENFTQRFVIYKEKNNTKDSIVREGTWKISNKTIYLNFLKDSIDVELIRMGYSDKFYSQNNLYDCKERTREIGKLISMYKKVN